MAFDWQKELDSLLNESVGESMEQDNKMDDVHGLALASMNSLATILSSFHTSLSDAGLPEDLVNSMTMMLLVKMLTPTDTIQGLGNEES